MVVELRQQLVLMQEPLVLTMHSIVSICNCAESVAEAVNFVRASGQPAQILAEIHVGEDEDLKQNVDRILDSLQLDGEILTASYDDIKVNELVKVTITKSKS